MSQKIKISVYKKSSGKWVEYLSIKEAAEALYVSPTSLHSYLNYKTKKSYLDVYKFKINGVDFKPLKTKKRKLDYRILARVKELFNK
jgi:aspartate/tyrosine/aromatic aminotransferase